MIDPTEVDVTLPTTGRCIICDNLYNTKGEKEEGVCHICQYEIDTTIREWDEDEKKD